MHLMLFWCFPTHAKNTQFYIYRAVNLFRKMSAKQLTYEEKCLCRTIEYSEKKREEKFSVVD